ncbi:hypothetical protein VSDG_05591 [Cytospora chrysosperma]|uniref:Uncharacterized protein n=1 Tax=Cytospora chrysosperma TaxID=252740 RepID=A0A423W058_CYTCH|nr:hypothetical protein VSDG_05591 [Valsa sordida]
MPSLGNGRKFQLPALDFKFGSLTEGTDIPPPLPSPKEEEPREKPKAPQSSSNDANVPSITTNGTQKPPETATSNGLKRPAEDVPLPSSPSSSTAGQGSVRRLLSRNRLDTAFANGITKADLQLNKSNSRPGTGSNASIATDKQSKRASGFFHRFRSSNGKVVVPADVKPDVRPVVASPTRTTGPPPPMIPEFKSLGSKVDLGDDKGSLGDDLFKNIK